MPVPYTFGTATAAIPLTQLDSNFATAITIGNTAVYLGNTTTSIGNLSLANVTITSVSTPITPAQGGTGLTSITANSVMIGNATGSVLLVSPGTAGNVLVSTGTTWTSNAAVGQVYPGAGIANSTGSAWGTSYSTTGSGTVVALATSPTFVSPILGTPTSATLTNATGLPLTTGVTGILPIANGGSGTATPSLVAGTNVTITGTWPNQTIASTAGGTGTVTSVSVVSSNGFAGTVANPTSTPAITLTTSITGVLKGNGTAISAATAGTDYLAPSGALGTPSSGTATNLTGLPLSTGVTGTLPIANGGTNSTATPTAGGVGYGTGTANAYTTAGTAGQFLQSNGAAAPSWVAAGSGALTLLSTVNASTSSTVDVETTFSSTYDAYLIIGTGITVSNNNTELRMRMKIGGSYISSASYTYIEAQLNSNSGTFDSVRANAAGQNSHIQLAAAVGNAASISANVVIKIFNPSNTSFSKMAAIECYYASSTFEQYYNAGGAQNSGTAALTGIRFFAQAGTINAGAFRLYGISNS